MSAGDAQDRVRLQCNGAMTVHAERRAGPSQETRDMLVIEMRAHGGPEVLKLAERPDPAPAEGEVVVDIHAASVNAADWKIRRGTSVHAARLPHVPGRDFSGVVSAVGAGADFAVGDAVFGVCPADSEAAYAERIAIPARYVTARPEGYSHAEAAAIALAGLTAMVALEDCLALKPGEKILVQGGAGGVGSLALQIAHHIGAHVGTTARSENHDYVRAQGADLAIDYRTEDVAAVFGNCDAAFDCVGSSTVATTFAALKHGGRAAFIALGRTPPAPPRADLVSLKPDVFRSRDRIERLARLARLGAIRPPHIERMPLAEAARAHALSEAGHVRGKIVLEVG
jgi:NADPH:quinone reductase-like Zn-dependent oxidoreductase